MIRGSGLFALWVEPCLRLVALHPSPTSCLASWYPLHPWRWGRSLFGAPTPQLVRLTLYFFCNDGDDGDCEHYNYDCEKKNGAFLRIRGRMMMIMMMIMGLMNDPHDTHTHTRENNEDE